MTVNTHSLTHTLTQTDGPTQTVWVRGQTSADLHTTNTNSSQLDFSWIMKTFTESSQRVCTVRLSLLHQAVSIIHIGIFIQICVIYLTLLKLNLYVCSCYQMNKAYSPLFSLHPKKREKWSINEWIYRDQLHQRPCQSLTEWQGEVLIDPVNRNREMDGWRQRLIIWI